MKNKTIAIIGAGLGGLSAGISLAARGYQVEIYEKNDKPGGKLNVLERDGFTFDLGPSILTLPQYFESLFKRAGKSLQDYVSIEPVLPHWRNFFEDGMTVDLTPDKSLMAKELEKFPNQDPKEFYNFLEYSKKLYEVSEEGYLRNGLDNFKETKDHYGLLKSMTGFDILHSMDQGVRKYIKDPKLVDILNYFIKYVGSSPYDAPAVMNSLPFIQFAHGLWYIKGGMHAMAKAMEKVFFELGGTIRYDSHVKNLNKDSNHLTSLVLADGTPIQADIFVSNMEVIPLYRDVLKEDAKMLGTLKKFIPSCSGFVLHLGIDRTYSQLAHHNFFYSKNAKQHFDSVFKFNNLSDDPTIYLVAPCKTDPSQAPKGCEIIKILPHIPHLKEGVDFTENEFRQYKDTVLTKLERMGLENLRKHVVYEDEWHPADIQKKYLSNQGSIYGVASHRFKNMGFKAPKLSGVYSNLYFVGGSVNPGPGMPMVTLSGQLVADQILRENQ